ncbi:MAG: S9 family peptidase [Rhizomicrobium sp.]
MAHMYRVTRGKALVVCGLLLAAPCVAQTLPPAEAFGQLPAISQPALSPDGKHLAAIQAYNGRPAAVIYNLDATSGSRPVILPYSDGFIVGMRWKNNSRLLITINRNQTVHFVDGVVPLFRTVSVGTAGENPVILFSRSARDFATSLAEIADLDIDDETHVYMPLVENIMTQAVSTGLYQVDVTDGDAVRIGKAWDGYATWIMDGHGKLIAALVRPFQSLTEYLMLYQDDEAKPLAVVNASSGNTAAIEGLTIDGAALARRAVNQGGIEGLLCLALTDATETPLFFDTKYDIDEPLFDPWSGRVIGVSFIADWEEYRYFDPKMEALQKGLEAAFPGTSVHAVAWDTAQDKLVVAVDGPREPRAYYLLDRTTHHASGLSRTYPNLSDADVGEVKTYPYKARDGLDIPAYLTLPPGKPAKNLPTVIMPHGGPMERDQIAFDWMAQFLANRGYAVLQPNFRGSAGYGEKFMEAGFGEWGRKMQDDVTDGVQKLIADGIADPKRICIVGASYGGYAALAGAAFTPDLYACAASWAGVSDLNVLYETESDKTANDPAILSAWARFIGDHDKDAAKLEAASPDKFADHIKCPVLLMHGTDDTTVSIKQSEIMEDVLRDAHKKVEFVKFDKETHYMETADTRIRVLKELEKFLKENIGN